MFRFALCTFAFFISSTVANAQLRNFEPEDIFSAAQCELGNWAREANYTTSDVARQTAGIKVTGSEVQTKAAGLDVSTILGNFLPGGGVSYSTETTQSWETSQVFNIHRENADACARNRPNVGVLQCFRKQRRDFLKGADFKCTMKVAATSKANANGKFTLWIINAGPSGSLSSTRTFDVTLTAPQLRSAATAAAR